MVWDLGDIGHYLRSFIASASATHPALERNGQAAMTALVRSHLEQARRHHPVETDPLKMGSSGITRGFSIGWCEGTGKKTKEFLEWNPGWAKPG
jgi:hypothetical protein